MTVPRPPEAPPEFTTARLGAFFPAFLLGWGLGAALTFAVRALGGALLQGPCEGRTLLALSLPLLLGPGGLAFTAATWRRPGRAALGLGLVAASLMPALYVGARDIATLRGGGCAGGYVVFSAPGGAPVSGLSLAVGERRTLSARIGGYTAQTHPGPFTLSAQGSAPGVVVTLPKTSVRAGEVFPVIVSIRPGTGVNTYTLGVQGATRQGGREVVASSSLGVTVRR